MLGWAVAGKLLALHPAQEDNRPHLSLARQQRLRGRLQHHPLSRQPFQPRRKSPAVPHRPCQRHNRRLLANVNTRTRFNARLSTFSALPRARWPSLLSLWVRRRGSLAGATDEAVRNELLP
jgi:hypothetical protein